MERRVMVLVSLLLIGLGELALGGTTGPKTGPSSTGSLNNDPWAYFGVYELETGELFQGGLLEEGKEEIWGFGDPVRPGVGGLIYEPVDAHRFSSVLKAGSTLEFREQVGGSFQEIVVRDGDLVRRGKRAFAIERRDAQLPVAGGLLEASLLVPECAGPRPLVVLVPGSGRSTRHGSVYSSFFLAQGMAVLVYDKRDASPETEGWQEPSLRQIADDVRAALDWGRQQISVDPDRSGIFGSSQGGWTGSMAAVRAPEADFLIVRAGPGVTELETHLHEVRQELRDEGLSGSGLDNAIQLYKALYSVALAGGSIDHTDALVEPWLETDWYRSAFGEGPVRELWSSRWWSWAGENMGVTAIPSVEAYGGPVLWFLAEEDQNVPPVASHAALVQAFDRSPGEDHEIRILPGVRHDFLVDMPSPEAHFVPGFWDRIAEWFAERGLSEPGCWSE